MNIPDDLKYAETHEWIRVDGDIATVGISDHAQEELSDIVFAEPPNIGDSLTVGKPAAVVESVKAASDIYAPVSGEVVEINEALSSAPDLINTDPYGAGWIFKVKISDPLEVDDLSDAETYREQISE